MVSTQGRNTWIVDDLVPYVEKITILSEEQERIIEPLSHGPPIEHEFPAQQLNILQSSVETKGIARRRKTIEAEPYLYPQMVERGHGMYHTHQHFLSIQHRCISIHSKLIKVILLQANIH